MDSVKRLYISILDPEIDTYVAKKGPNLTDEMRQKCDEVFTKLDAILRKEGFLTEQTAVKKEDSYFIFIFSEDISFDKSVELLHSLGTTFKVSSFSFESEYDRWAEEEPYVNIGIYSTI